VKLNFKTIIVIFLVALLGAGIGTFGVLSINKEYQTKNANELISSVEYLDIQKNDYTKAIEKAYATVVEITSTYETQTYNFWGYGSGTSEATAAGSGVIISEDGYIVTNEHVISGSVNGGTIKVKLSSGEETDAVIVGYDSRTDIAVIKIDASSLTYASFVDSDQLVLGQDVIAIGNPLGYGISCSNGIVSALSREIYINNVYMTVLQTNAAVNSGNSGGGLFDINGNLVGIINAKTSSSTSDATVEGMGYAIPANTAKRIVTELLENGYVKDRAALGIKVYTQYYANVEGVVVSAVIEGGAAEVAGIKVDDIITKINDIKISQYADLVKALDAKLVGDTVTITVLRNEEELTLKVVLQNSFN